MTRCLVRLSLANRHLTSPQLARDLKESTDTELAPSTVCKSLRDNGLRGYWRAVLFHDESTFTVQNHSGNNYVRRPGEEFKPERILSRIKQPTSVMVWGCFSAAGPGRLHFVNGMMNAEKYHRVLRNVMIPFTRSLFDREWLFKQDDDPCYTARRVKKWFADNNVNTLTWPAQSPDLNPIKNLWNRISNLITEDKPTNKRRLMELIVQSWDRVVTPEELQTLTDNVRMASSTEDTNLVVVGKKSDDDIENFSKKRNRRARRNRKNKKEIQEEDSGSAIHSPGVDVVPVDGEYQKPILKPQGDDYDQVSVDEDALAFPLQGLKLESRTDFTAKSSSVVDNHQAGVQPCERQAQSSQRLVPTGQEQVQTCQQQVLACHKQAEILVDGHSLAFPQEAQLAAGDDGPKRALKSRGKTEDPPKLNNSQSRSSTPRKFKAIPSDPKPKPTQYRSTEPLTDSFKYWSKAEVAEGLLEGTILEGPLRINPRNYRQCFIPHTNNYIDVYVPWRNRALNGDLVAVHLLEKRLSRVLVEDIETFLDQKGLADRVSFPAKNSNDHRDYLRLQTLLDSQPDVVELLQDNASANSDFPEKFLQPVGVVVDITEQKHSRRVAGQLLPRTDGNTKFAQFHPNDSRIPRLDIPINCCPKDFLQRPNDYKDILYVARITAWKEGNARANGVIVRAMGSRQEIEPMTESILMEYGVDIEDFNEEVNACLPTALPWQIPSEERSYRKDLTKECIFTVDPSTARDLDDAMSCKEIKEGIYEIGVHIADVAFFIEQGSALDLAAAARATSVYMVQKVIPMLPRLLCEQLCSLNPDEERLAFSVQWHIDMEGNITHEWFGRSVIKSCAKLSYQHAQGFIENPDREWQSEELPPISEGFTVADIKERVIMLDKIAKVLRKRRFEAGALRLDQTKLSYTLNKDTGYPTGYFVYELKDSNRMIEEFMLLANMAVARKIHKSYPEKAILRMHPEPQGKQLSDLELVCSQMGLFIDTTNSHTMQDSLSRYTGGQTEEEIGKFQVLMQLCTKPMQRAKYFCTGCVEDEALYRHYALSVPFYTHFTSPIRRYADLMVHRLLAAALGYCAEPAADSKALNTQAKHCNAKKDNAKEAGALSLEMFFVAFLKDCESVIEQAMVMTVLDQSVDVVCIKLGYKKRVYTDKLPLTSPVRYDNRAVPPTLTLFWPSLDPQSTNPVTQILSVFSIVKCRLLPGSDIIHFTAELLHPDYVPSG
ncbi:DIS3-like exonuclease 2 [Watersipora subatra]|uniref:DIS3-like exonuclease 2 n=1 Tax=Watersipora subatra TaxID=2589382 RepID=UPI00355B1690